MRLAGEPIDYTVHIAFYEDDTERMLTTVDHAQVPRVGDRVWLTAYNDDGTKDTACWEVHKVVWHYTAPASPNGLDGKMGGFADIIVFRSLGVFR